MKAALRKTGFLLFLFGLIQVAGGCIMEDRVIELVVNETTCVDFLEDHDTVLYGNSGTVNYADKINEILDENGVSRDKIVSARLVSASYGVTELDPAHDDWIITGSITVEWEDASAPGVIIEGPATLWEYTDVSISAALGKKIPATLNRAGVEILNKALADFIAGGVRGNPVLTFRVVNTGVGPHSPNSGEPIQFAWKGCIVVDIVTETDVEVPDPF
ncbi:MAG: hypothetical protein NTW97_02250 [Candidatus Krumholzibacteria bacterium]|nr:hypothetical protein [Candidatus Krumholzibacteria bacterium]